MSVEAPVVNTAAQVATWSLSRHIDAPAGGVAANGIFDVADVQFTAKAGHRYCVVASVTGFLNGQIGGKFYLRHGDDPADVIAQAQAKMHRGGSAFFITMPVSLSGTFTVGTAGPVHVILSFQPDATWHDWVLATAFHNLTVLDLGAA